MGLVIAFAETLSFENDSVSPEELWNWVKNVCQQCPHDSSEGLCKHKPLEAYEVQVQSTGEDKLKWIQEHHDSPAAGHPGRAKTYELLSRSHSWEGM